jgi:hypothetical protein
MKKLSTWTSSLGVSLLLLSAACQLNDLDSAPRAPDSLGDETEDSISPAQVGPVSAASAPRGSNAGSSLDAGTGSVGDAGNTTPPNAVAGDAALDAAPTPGFPILPSLEAGTLPPGNFGSLGDASIADAIPNG